MTELRGGASHTGGELRGHALLRIEEKCLQTTQGSACYRCKLVCVGCLILHVCSEKLGSDVKKHTIHVTHH